MAKSHRKILYRKSRYLREFAEQKGLSILNYKSTNDLSPINPDIRLLGIEQRALVRLLKDTIREVDTLSLSRIWPSNNTGEIRRIITPEDYSPGVYEYLIYDHDESYLNGYNPRDLIFLVPGGRLDKRTHRELFERFREKMWGLGKRFSDLRKDKLEMKTGEIDSSFTNCSRVLGSYVTLDSRRLCNLGVVLKIILANKYRTSTTV